MNKNLGMRFRARKFMETEVYNSYSPFCQKVIEYFNRKLESNDVMRDYSIDYDIVLRGDKKITFSTTLDDRNLVTLTPNKTRNYMREAETHHNGKHSGRINSLADIDRIFKYTKNLLEELYKKL